MAVLAERFPDWVESVELLPGSDRLSALRAAAETLGAGLRPSGVLELVAYAVGRDSASAFESVSNAVTASDPSFAGAAADLEPRLVASAAVARALESDDDTAAIVAGAVLSAEFAGLRAPVVELPALARAAQARRFGRVRERVAMPRIEFGPIADEIPNPHAAPWRSGEEADRLAGATSALTQQLTQILSDLAERFETRLDAADEELDVLWWAFSSRGEPADGWNDAAPGPDVFLRAGRELADRHRFNAEIPTARAILRRVLGPRGDEEYVLADAIGASAGRVELDSAPPGPLLPILTANAAYLDAGGDPGWVDAAAARGVDATIRRRGEEIAAQTLRELLLVGAMRT
jgi:hypothetical protein